MDGICQKDNRETESGSGNEGGIFMAMKHLNSRHPRNPGKFLAPLLIFFLALAALQLSFLAAPGKAPAQSNTPDSNAPQADGGVQALAVANGVTYAAGDFSKFGNVDAYGLAAIGPSGSVRGYEATSDIAAIAVAGKTIYIGGNFSVFGKEWPPTKRNHLAAIGVDSGGLLGWNPDADAMVRGFCVSGNTLYTAGFFNAIGGKPRSKIAAFDTTTGKLLDWNPGVEISGYGENTGIFGVGVIGNTLYVGGYFTSVGGSERMNLAAFDATTGALLPWNPGAGGAGDKVTSLLVDQGTVYFSGGFLRVGESDRTCLAAVDAITGSPTSLNQGLGDVAWALALNNSTLYAGGYFGVLGTDMYNLVGIDTTTGAVTDFNPNVNDTVLAIAFRGNTMCVGGDFTTVGGATRNYYAEFSAPVPPWQPTRRDWGHDSIGAPDPATTWYLAEGCTAEGYETYVCVQNPNDTAADISITYMTSTGPVNGPSESLGANSRKTYKVEDTVDNAWDISTKVKSNKPVIAERSMYGNGRQWGHESIGTSKPATTWYLAEGCTAADFETFVCVQNPNDTAADVSITYMTSTGPVNGPSEPLGANSRKTYKVKDTVDGAWEVSTKVKSNKPVIAERSMYGGNRIWGTDSIGISTPAEDWYLAEGCTAGDFETFVCVQNPNDTAATVTITYMTPDGAVPGPVLPPLKANSRRTYVVGDSLKSWSVSTRIESDKPVVAERPMYGRGRVWATDSIGTSAPASQWYLAEGCTGAGFETWILVQNPNSTPATITITYMTPTGTVTGPTDTLDADSRNTYNVAATVNNVWEISTKVTSDKKVICERSMYGNSY